MFYSTLFKLKEATFQLHFARDQIARWTREHFDRVRRPPYHVLDIGLGGGGDLKKIREECAGMDVTLHGLESIPECVAAAREAGIHAYPINIERDRLPFPDEMFEVVLANHVIEHTKELFWIFSEISRVVKKGGMVIIGCPNLGSWHNRLSLLFGGEPPCMKLLSGHLRGITKPGFREMIEKGGYFELVKYRGANFYPFPTSINEAMAKMMPTLAASHHFVLRRTAKPGLYIDVLDDPVNGMSDTPYYRGPGPAGDHREPDGVDTFASSV